MKNFTSKIYKGNVDLSFSHNTLASIIIVIKYMEIK